MRKFLLPSWAKPDLGQPWIHGASEFPAPREASATCPSNVGAGVAAGQGWQNAGKWADFLTQRGRPLQRLLGSSCRWRRCCWRGKCLDFYFLCLGVNLRASLESKNYWCQGGLTAEVTAARLRSAGWLRRRSGSQSPPASAYRWTATDSVVGARAEMTHAVGRR